MRWMMLMAVGAFLLVSAQFCQSLWSREDSANNHPSPVDRVEVLQSRVFAGGMIEGAEPEVSIKFEVPGRIEAVPVREGERVKAGQLLATLNSSLAKLRVEEATAQLKIARAEREQLHRTSTAGRDSNRKLTGPRRSPVDGDRSPPQVRHSAWEAESPSADDDTVADAKVALAEAALRRENLMLERCKLRAPIDGVVLLLQLRAGELTGPTEGYGSVTLADTTHTRVRAYVEEFDVHKVALGNRAFVTVSGQRHLEFTGVVVACSPYVRPKSYHHLRADEHFDVRVREVLIDLEDDPDLLIGLPAEVFIEPIQSD